MKCTVDRSTPHHQHSQQRLCKHVHASPENTWTIHVSPENTWTTIKYIVTVNVPFISLNKHSSCVRHTVALHFFFEKNGIVSKGCDMLSHSPECVISLDDHSMLCDQIKLHTHEKTGYHGKTGHCEARSNGSFLEKVVQSRTVRNVPCTIGIFRTAQLHKVFRTSRLCTMKNTCPAFSQDPVFSQVSSLIRLRNYSKKYTSSSAKPCISKSSLCHWHFPDHTASHSFFEKLII